MLSRMNAVERHSAQKLHSSAIALLQIFDLYFAGSRVATRSCDVMYVPYLLRTFLFIRNYVAILRKLCSYTIIALSIILYYIVL